MLLVTLLVTDYIQRSREVDGNGLSDIHIIYIFFFFAFFFTLFPLLAQAMALKSVTVRQTTDNNIVATISGIILFSVAPCFICCPYFLKNLD